MKIRMLILLLAAAVLLTPSRTPQRKISQSETITMPVEVNHPPAAFAGRDFITYVDLLTEFRGYGSSAGDEIVYYEWDFDGDGVYDFRSDKTGTVSFVYNSAGTYQAALKVYDSQRNAAIDTTQVIVKPGTGKQEYIAAPRVETVRTPSVTALKDGIVQRYAVMINGAYETRYWDDVTFMYATLTDDYHLPPDHIYLLNYDGTNPAGINPDNMIDDPAWLANIDAVFTSLATIIDGDDELFVWVTDHGRGYCGPKLQAYGYLNGFASVDPDDEQDVLEKDFKLRSLMTGGDLAYPYYNHGMNEIKVYILQTGTSSYYLKRNKYVSTFTEINFESSGVLSDQDVYIEKLVDYLLGDTNRDGYVDTTQGEVFDYDEDGAQPFYPRTGFFDEDDWGGWDYYVDDFNYINSGFPGDSYIIFDQNFDNHLDIDINPDPDHLVVDGTDLDNQGLFDGIDVNQDGDMEDWVSIDEMVNLAIGSDMLDDDLAVFLNRIDASVITIFMEQCFSGGFIEDLSGSNRVIAAATEEDTVSWGNVFVEYFTEALHWATRSGSPVDADKDHNGHISMMEAFNYAAERDYTWEIPQYDDNGDNIGSPYPIPQGGDGSLGARTYLESFFYSLYLPFLEK